MQTIYDWLSVLLFCAIALTFLHRSLSPAAKDRVLAYLPPALGCAAANWLGNQGLAIPAAICLAATAVYYLAVLRPLRDFT